MCSGGFGGRIDEYMALVYGDGSLTRFCGIVVLDNKISSGNVRERSGLLFTDFSRTLFDMHGVKDAVRYYYRNDESLDGIFVVPEHQGR